MKSHFLRIGGIYTPQQHPVGFSAPRKQAEAVIGGWKTRKQGTNAFLRDFFWPFATWIWTYQCFLAPDRYTISFCFFPCYTAKESLQALPQGTLLAHCSGDPPPHLIANYSGTFPKCHAWHCWGRWAFPNYSPPPGPARTGLSSPSPSTACKTSHNQGWNPSAVPVLWLANPKEKHGAGYASSEGFPLLRQISAGWAAKFLLPSSVTTSSPGHSAAQLGAWTALPFSGLCCF